MRIHSPLVLLVLMSTAAVAWADDLLLVYAQARAADPLLAQAQALLGIQQEQTRQARAALLPQWSLSATDNRGYAHTTGIGNTLALGSSVNQVLWDLSRLRDWQASRELTSAEAARVIAAEQTLRARTATAYFGVLSAQAALTNAQNNEAAFARQAQDAQNRLASGLSAALDVEQARAFLALAQSNTLAAAETLADARQALSSLTGQPAGALQALAPGLSPQAPTPADAQSWVERLQHNHPLLQAARLNVAASAQRLAARQAAHAPTLALVLDSQRSRGDGVPAADAARLNTQVALRLTVPLFAGGATDSAARQARHQQTLANEELEATRRQLQREAHAQHQAVSTSALQMRAAHSAVEAADKALASTRAGLSLGTRNVSDLLQAIQTLGSAQGALDQARHRHVLARLLLQQAVGDLGDAELAAANTLLETR